MACKSDGIANGNKRRSRDRSIQGEISGGMKSGICLLQKEGQDGMLNKDYYMGLGPCPSRHTYWDSGIWVKQPHPSIEPDTLAMVVDRDAKIPVYLTTTSTEDTNSRRQGNRALSALESSFVRVLAQKKTPNIM